MNHVIRLTVDDIMRMHPCESYPRKRVKALWNGRKSLTLEEIAALPLDKPEDAIWVRWAVAEYGSAEDRKALRGDENAYVRKVVAEYGSAEDRKALRGDENAYVRKVVAVYGKND